MPQDIRHEPDIAEVRDVANGARPRRQECSGENGQSRVLGASDHHLAGESPASFNSEYIHD